MKQLFRYLTLAVICTCALSACRQEQIDTDQFLNDGVSFAAMAPNPVSPGGQLTIVGSHLEQVDEVVFAGGLSERSIQVVSSGKHSEIRVTVPVYGLMAGPVTIVDNKGNRYSSLAWLNFIQPVVQY